MTIPAQKKQATPWFGYDERGALNPGDRLFALDQLTGQPFNFTADKIAAGGGNANIYVGTFADILNGGLVTPPATTNVWLFGSGSTMTFGDEQEISYGG